jgi:quercetin dioxygenase-like cupin family protein
MNAKDWEKKLREEGFGRIFTWEDGPNAHYPDHTHASLTAHIVLDGEMTLTSQGETRTYKPGDRCDVPANTIHSAQMGPRGCKYMVGEK